MYKLPNQTYNTLEIPPGRSIQCVEQPGKYKFKLESCHVFESDTVLYNTANESNEIFLSAVKHKNTIYVSVQEYSGNITIIVNIGGIKKIEGPLVQKNKKYQLDFYLGFTQKAILIPQSDVLYFNPPILQINGNDDCTDLGVKFEAVKGKVIKGKVTPPLAGVQITITSDNSDTLMDETDANGNYKFPPLDETKSYQLSALMDSYILVGPDENGDFAAHKLAEIIVEVVDRSYA